MKTFKPEIAETKICPLMSSIESKNCVSKKCMFWIDVIHLGSEVREVSEGYGTLIFYNGEEKKCGAEGVCGFLIKDGRFSK